MSFSGRVGGRGGAGVVHKHPVIVLRVAVGCSGGMREGGNQIGPPGCKDYVKSASFLILYFLNIFRNFDQDQNQVYSRYFVIIFGVLFS